MNPFGRWFRIESAGYDDKGRHEVGFGVGERGVVFFGLGYVFVRDEGLRRRDQRWVISLLSVTELKKMRPSNTHKHVMMLAKEHVAEMTYLLRIHDPLGDQRERQ